MYEIESEGSSSREDPGEASSSRSNQQVRVELNATNLVRVDEQPLVRGPLKQLEVASEQMRKSNHRIYREIDRLDASILEHQETVEYLRNRTERISYAQSPEERTELQKLEKQLTNTLQRIQQEEEQKLHLAGQVDQSWQLVDANLRRRGLAGSRSAKPGQLPGACRYDGGHQGGGPGGSAASRLLDEVASDFGI